MGTISTKSFIEPRPDERREPRAEFRVRFPPVCTAPRVFTASHRFTHHGHAERVEPSRINNKLTKALIVQLKP